MGQDVLGQRREHLPCRPGGTTSNLWTTIEVEERMRLWLLDQKSFGMKTEMEVLYTSYTGEGVRNVGETRFGGNLN